jgi:hypothetical protein
LDLFGQQKRAEQLIDAILFRARKIQCAKDVKQKREFKRSVPIARNLLWFLVILIALCVVVVIRSCT